MQFFPLKKRITRLWYDTDIPFNATNFPYYQPMIDAIATCGSSFKRPGFHDIKEPLLQKELQRIDECLMELK